MFPIYEISLNAYSEACYIMLLFNSTIGYYMKISLVANLSREYPIVVSIILK